MEEQLNFGLLPKLTKDYILERVLQEDIFVYYLNKVDKTFSKEILIDCLRGNTLICSPIRKDHNPTVGFRYSGKKLRYKDFNGHIWGDCFDLVAFLYREENFGKVLEIISKDFKIHKYGNDNNDITSNDIINGNTWNKNDIAINSSIYRHNSKTRIRIKKRPFDKRDAKYWGEICIQKGDLEKNNIFPCSGVLVNQTVVFEDWGRKVDLAYCYYFGKDENGIENVQIYYPRKRKPKFIQNFSGIIGLDNILPSRVAVITKSNKDRVALNVITKEEGISLQAFAVIPEGFIINKDDYFKLWTNFDYVVTNMDFDWTGRNIAWKYRNVYNIPSLFLTNGAMKTTNYGSKDFTEYLERNGREKSIKLIKNAESYIVNKFKRS